MVQKTFEPNEDEQEWMKILSRILFRDFWCGNQKMFLRLFNFWILAFLIVGSSDAELGNEMEIYTSPKKVNIFPDKSNYIPTKRNGTQQIISILNPNLGDWTISIYAKSNKNIRFGLLRPFSIYATTRDAPDSEIAQPVL